MQTTGNVVALCLAEHNTTPNSYPTLKFIADNKPEDASNRKYYFAQHKKGTPFSLDSSVNFYAVISYENSILIDSDIPTGNFSFLF